MLTWDQLSHKEQLQSIHWDLYKDVHGIRPRWMPYAEMSVEALEEEINSLQGQLEAVMANEAVAYNEAAAAFEQRVQQTIALGAKTRETAIAWIVDAEDVQGDYEFLCYKLGLRYGYFKEVVDTLVA